jgi:hypothetical protein
MMHEEHTHCHDVVLRPQMKKLKNLCDYCSESIAMICCNMQKWTSSQPRDSTGAHTSFARVIPDVLLAAFIDLMDVLIKLNVLADVKSGLRNDFTFYKRSVVHDREHVKLARGVCVNRSAIFSPHMNILSIDKL